MVIIRHLSIPLVGIRFQDASVEALLGDEVLGRGSLYVTEEQIMWLKETGVEGFTIQYKKMALHAISRDPNVHPRDCLYVMINGSLDGSDEQPIDDDEEDTTEIRFVPDNSGRLDQLYKAVQDCTLLHPDASSDMSESEDEDDDEEENDDGNLGLGVLQMAPPIPQHGMGGGRIIPGLRQDHELERQFGAMQAHFGPRLIFQDRSLGTPSNGNNGHASHGNAGVSPRDISPEEQFQDLDEDED